MQASGFSSCRKPAGLAAAVFLGLALSGCSGSTGPEIGRLDVILGQVGSGLAARVSAPGALAALGSQLGVPLDQVSEINVTVTSIQVHRVGADDGDGTEGTDGTESTDGSGDGDGSEGPWITVDLTGGGATAAGGIEINLLDLSEGFVVASADLPSGRYNQARIFFTDARIVFSGPVEAGGTMLEAGDHSLEIPSGEQSGIKVLSGFFDVDASVSESICLFFDPLNSVKNIVANANRISMTPVIIGTVGHLVTGFVPRIGRVLVAS